MAMLHLKNLSESVKRSLRKRAREKGLTMSDYVLQLIEEDLARPTPQELIARLEALPTHDEGPSGAELLEETRREREEELG